MNKKGFTLIELLLYIGISSIVITAVFAFISFMWQAKAKTIAIMETEEQGRDIVQNINRNLRNADAVSFPGVQTASDSMILSGTETKVYTLSAGVLYLSVNGGTNIPLHNNQVEVSSISFQNLSLADTPGIIRTQLDLNYVNLENRNERNYQKTFYSSASIRP